MPGIFLSYRREDSGGYACEAIYDGLIQRFGTSLVFRDIDTIDPGVDFVEEIEQAVASCDVLIAVIGPKWLTATDNQGRRRLDDTKDWVRLELETALNRNIRVVPMLLNGVSMPEEEALPESLKTFARRQAIEISEKHFRSDLNRLLQSMEKIVAKSEGKSDSIPMAGVESDRRDNPKGSESANPKVEQIFDNLAKKETSDDRIRARLFNDFILAYFVRSALLLWNYVNMLAGRVLAGKKYKLPKCSN